MQKNYDPTIDAFIEGLVQFGGHYHFEDGTLYTTDQSLLFPIGDRTATRCATCRDDGGVRLASRRVRSTFLN
jgi:hypothetical protein